MNGRAIHHNSPWMLLKQASGDHGWKDKDGKRISPQDGWRAKDGRRIEVLLSVSPVKDGAGAVVGAAAIARDITERKRAAEAL